MPVYSIGIIQFDDVSPGISTTDTVGTTVEGNTYTISASASPITIFIDDDENVFDDGFIDPPGNTTADNNQLIAEPVTINGDDYGPATAGGTPVDQIELEFAFATTDGDTYYVVRINGVNIGLSGPTLPTPGQTFEVTTSTDSQQEPYAEIPCFADGTEIQTPTGPRPVESLRAGDLVCTVDCGPQPLLRVTSRRLNADDLARTPHLRPVVFLPGAVGNTRRMRLSPQHRVLISGWRAELYFGEEQVLVPAKALVNDRTVTSAPITRGVSYFHLLFDAHQLVISDGAVTESLYPGAEAASRHSAGQADLFELFGPDWLHMTKQPLVRPVVAVREAAAVLRQTI